MAGQSKLQALSPIISPPSAQGSSNADSLAKQTCSGVVAQSAAKDILQSTMACLNFETRSFLAVSQTKLPQLLIIVGDKLILSESDQRLP